MFHVGFTHQSQVADYRDVLGYDKAAYAAFWRGMQEEGIRLIGRGLWYVSAAHTQADVARTLESATNVLKRLEIAA
jgi:glutamate-1-semialdehyde 2,1-aminomutase